MSIAQPISRWHQVSQLICNVLLNFLIASSVWWSSCDIQFLRSPIDRHLYLMITSVYTVIKLFVWWISEVFIWNFFFIWCVLILGSSRSLVLSICFLCGTLLKDCICHIFLNVIMKSRSSWWSGSWQRSNKHILWFSHNGVISVHTIICS